MIGLSTNKPKPRLAIDKDPPRNAVTKPKALQDTNFFSGLLNNSQPKGYRIRPAVPKQPPAWSASSQASGGSTAPLMDVNNNINGKGAHTYKTYHALILLFFFYPFSK